MNTKFLSENARRIIEDYESFKIGSASCTIPYFNNKSPGNRVALRVNAGKGSARDIYEEVSAIFIKNHVDPNAIDDEELKKLLVDSNIGIDCSGFAFYVLNAETEARNKGQLDRHIKFINCKGLVSKIRCSLRPVENLDVSTLANDRNSKEIALQDVYPSDLIVMLNSKNGSTRDHVLIIDSVDYQNFKPTTIHYVHAVAYPEDGLYGTGIRRGQIEIIDPQNHLTKALWTEHNKSGYDNPTYSKALSSDISIRRLNWF